MKFEKVVTITIVVIFIVTIAYAKITMKNVNQNNLILSYFEVKNQSMIIVAYEHTGYAFFPRNRATYPATFLRIETWVSGTCSEENYIKVGTKWYWSTPLFWYSVNESEATIFISGTTWTLRLNYYETINESTTVVFT